MALVDRANNILARLLVEQQLKRGEIAFIAHSFGGLITEQLLRVANDRAVSEPNVADFANRIRRIGFLGTPHLGADLASWTGTLRLIARPSSATKGLGRNNPELRGLNQWYRRFAPENGILTLTLIEGRRTLFGLIVKPDSSDPGLPSTAIPVDADHFSIASPDSRQSEIFVHVLDFLRAQVAPNSRQLFVADATLDTIADQSRQTTAVLERIEQRLISISSPPIALPTIPSFLVDSETEKRLLRIRQSRFIPPSNLLEQVSTLVYDLTHGELISASPSMKACALAWCARILTSKPDKSEAKTVFETARQLAHTEEVTIAQAFLESYERGYQSALEILSPLRSPAARSAAFVIVSNQMTALEALDWYERSGLSLSQLDADGKFYILKKQLDAGIWANALATANALQEADFDNAPGLLYLAGGAHLAQAVPDELITLVLWTLPFDAAPFPLADDERALAERREARNLYSRSSVAAATYGNERASNEASDRALWLGLRDPISRATARAELAQSMRDPLHSLRRLPLALQFGLKLDLKAVEEEIERQDKLSDGASPDAAVARFSLAMTKNNPGEVADYIARHRSQLTRHLNPSFVGSVEIQVLAQSGQIEKAEALALAQAGPDQTQQEKERLARIIAEAKGSNPVEARKAQFEKTDALTDLANLIELLESHRDWQMLVPYARIFFERTRDIAACRIYVQALFETRDFPALISLLQSHPDFTTHSPFIESLLAWALYRSGDVNESRNVLASLRSKRDDPNDRLLAVNLGIASGDWASLATFVEQEWQQRSERDASELLRAGQLARQIGSGRAKELIFAAVASGNDDPAILIGSYGAAVSAGWETNETAVWLERAAALSGEDGPVKTMALKDVVNLNPEWQQRETSTWEQFYAAQLPLFTVGRLLNRSLVDLQLMPALANPETSDPRRRTLIYAYSGARGHASGSPRSFAIDPTAALTLGAFDALDDLLARAQTVVVPHNMLGWLFEEKQKIQFHQPSKIAEAKELKSLIDSKALSKFEATAVRQTELAAEIGDELASLFAEAEADFGEDRRQRLVVRPSPLHRIGSLMEEEAELGRHEDSVCGCLDLVDALVRQGQLTEAEQQHARAYLALHEKAWPTAKRIEPGAILYLDELAVSYLQHLHLLSRLQPAGFTAILPLGEILQAERLIKYEALSNRAAAVIEKIRHTLSDGISANKVKLAPESRNREDRSPQLDPHPSFDVIETAELVDVVVIDDRYFNKFSNLLGSFGTRPIWTTYDLLTSDYYDPARKQDHLTRMRRAGMSFVPVAGEELEALLARSQITDGHLDESAELKALRESILMARMSTGLLLPAENTWFEGFLRAIIGTIKSQWREGSIEEVAAARSNWLLSQLDIRHWAHRFKIGGHPEATQARYRAQILSLALLHESVPAAIRQKYWAWLEDKLLTPIQNEERDLFASILDQVRSLVVEGTEQGLRIGEEDDAP
ncbi:hypothetical protein KMZ93_19815 [Bradyrhizobium sediminis]|uniref:HTH domain-containing protein n=2 Tax=Bradyrhizobium sediminis TaxID=2840469 RepID=A0A975NVS9_9BRAD|nr:hypothetical protein [Bradyrhizobium sediminis]QWG22207.1 hypothetical protein KMZ93_19815 [Bradyrhizobium sediminis]